ncbi:MAG TPA: ABC transporter permease [Pirellulales bacterium]|jgi:peptide/nickel transport system permease protein|nr:ABC transporter permease [Pirellulales bacterium]
MWNYLVRRLILGIFTLWAVTFLVYMLIRWMPGDPLLARMEQMSAGKKIRAEDREQMKKIYGLDKPAAVAYFAWLGNVLQLNLGNSFSRYQPVTQVIGERIGPTLLLSGTSLLLGYLLAVPMGLYATARGGKLDERALSVSLYMLYSLPAFVAALYLQMIFAVKLQGTWLELPLDGMTGGGFDGFSMWGKAWDLFQHALLPTICMTYGTLAYDTRFIQANMQEVLRQDYIRTARAKGVSRTRVIVHHAFRNTLIPFVTMLGLELPLVLSGAIILEQIFTWPGMGRLFFEAIREYDYPTIMGLVLLFSVLTLLGQLLADILYAVVDPRVTYS